MGRVAIPVLMLLPALLVQLAAKAHFHQLPVSCIFLGCEEGRESERAQRSLCACVRVCVCVSG